MFMFIFTWLLTVPRSGGYSVAKVAMDDETSEITKASNYYGADDDPMLGGTLQSESLRTFPRDRDSRKSIWFVLFIDALATILTALCGGLLQTTPYIGHSTYRKLGAKRDYSWMFAVLLIVLCGSGSMSYLAQALPETVLKPIFILIALQITEFAFGIATSDPVISQYNRYIPALTMALFPSIGQLMNINLGAADSAKEAVVVISAGFVITSILWGQVTLSIIEGKRVETFAFFLCLALLTFFGLIHSATGKVYYDIWNQDSFLPKYTAAAYLICALLALVFVPAVSHPITPGKA